MTNVKLNLLISTAFIMVVAWLIWVYVNSGPVKLPSGVIIPYTPTQKKPVNPVELELPGFDIHALAEFEINAKVLGVESYSLDDMSLFSPIDLALGWGMMSDQDVVDQLEITQSGRWYKYRSNSNELNMRKVAVHSANMHMIPGDSTIERVLESVRVGEIVMITGYLVKVRSHESNQTWISSMKRTDTGGGACEIVWVSDISVVKII